ncbi:MAG: serine/threonine protein kinase, partial [Myxococcaceae bacterium]|nr:serine/threonine protein kinase [Myxococcaceae bacterium]
MASEHMLGPVDAPVCSTCGLRPVARPGERCAECQAPTRPLNALGATAAPDEALAAGQVLLGQYRLERKLGEGGMAEVWLGHDQQLDRPVALKVMATALARDRAAVARFEREARMTAGLEHPHVVAVHQVGQSLGRPLLVMKYLPGVTLSTWAAAQRPRLEWSALRPKLAQLVEALEFLHARKLVHRDVKPSNVMVAPDGHVTLLDFGILKAVEGEQTSQGALLGTPLYMAPEQVLGVADLDARADVYALAVTVYALLEGALPFKESAGHPLLAEKVGSQAPTPGAKRLPPAAVKVLMRALERDRTRRPASARALLSELDRAFDAGETGRGPRAGLVAGVALGVLVAGVGA